MRSTPLSLSFVLFALLLSAPLRAQDAQKKSWPSRTVPDFGVIFNEDGDNNFPTKDQDYNRRYLRDSVDSMLGSGVRAHARCIGAGSDVVYYPTKVASTVGWRKVAKESSTVSNGRLGMEAGLEPLRVVGDRCKELGIAFFPSVRMNDAHFARTPDDHQLTGKFWLDNRDLAMKGNNRLDFSHEKVRKFRLDQIFEALDRYGDISSGVQLDFNRHAMFFPNGQAREKAHLITEMMVAVREKLDQLEKQHGRPFYCMVRVEPTIALAKAAGLDVDEWMRRRLVDVVTPTQLYNTSWEMPIGEYLGLGKETGCKVYPTMYIRTQYTWPLVAEPTEASYATEPSTVPTKASVAGLAENYAMMGVDGFEMYNYHLPLGETALLHARALSMPRSLTLVDRTYPITPSHGSDGLHDPRNAKLSADAPKRALLKQLPVDIAKGKSAELTMLIGQDLGPERVRPDAIALRLGITGAKEGSQLKITLNGTQLHAGAIDKVVTRVTGGADLKADAVYLPLPQHFVQVRVPDASKLKRGENAITVEYTDGSAESVKVLEAQLGVLYTPPSRRGI